MGRKVNISQTTVISTELIPLTDIFELIPNGQTEQWFYENTNVFKPDRQITPLVITPKVTAIDEDTKISYVPSFYLTEWYALEFNGTTWVETQIINQTEGLQYDYVIVGNSLKVNKNVNDAAHGVQIKCIAQYIDPRDSGIIYAVEETLLLTANKDATVIYPKIDILAESSQAFNPLDDRSSQYTFKGTADWTDVPDPSANITKYKVDPLGIEAIIPDNESALVTSAPTMDIRYGKGTGSVLKENQQFMSRQVSGGTVATIPSNIAYIEKIKGNTVKWNQKLSSNTAITLDIDNARTALSQLNTTIDAHKVLLSFSIKDVVSSQASYQMGAKFQNQNTGDTSAASMFEISNGVKRGIVSVSETSTKLYFFINTNVASGTSLTITANSINIIDLTEMFGAGNEPETAADFESWLAANIGLKSYYPYNAGELIPAKMSAIKSVGFNLWDEKYTLSGLTEDGSENHGFQRITSGYIKVEPTTTYYLKAPNNIYYCQYDNMKNCCVERQSMSPNRGFSTSANTHYIRFMLNDAYGQTYNHDVCINLSDPSRNGTYEAHWEAVQNLPITELKGKVNGLGNSVVIFPNGMNKVGNVYDEIKVENEVVRAVKRCDIDNGEVVALQTAVTYTIDNLPRGLFEWYGVKNGAEVKIDTLPCYVSGQHTDTLVVDAMYSEEMAIILRVKDSSFDNTVLPPREQRSVVWKIPPIDSIITSDKGSAVRSDSTEFNFSTLVNINGQALSEEKIVAHLRFKWMMRKSNASATTNKGWGRTMTANKEELINVRGLNNSLASTAINNEVYLLGAYEAVTYDGEQLTYNNEPLFGRSAD